MSHPSKMINSLLNSGKILTIPDYLKLIGREKYEYLENKNRPEDLFIGMLKWPDDDDPYSWGGPFEKNYVFVRIIKYNTILTEVDVFNRNKEGARNSKYNRHPQALIRAGFDDNYWIRPYVDANGVEHPSHLCNYSAMNEDEIAKVESVETADEHMYYELKYCRYLLNTDMLPKNQPTIEHPYCLYLAGNDDCSYSMYYDPNKCEITKILNREVDILSWDAYKALKNPSWHWIKEFFHFTN